MIYQFHFWAVNFCSNLIF